MNAAAGSPGDTAIESKQLSGWTFFFINLNKSVIIRRIAVFFLEYFKLSGHKAIQTLTFNCSLINVLLNAMSFVTGKARETWVAALPTDHEGL